MVDFALRALHDPNFYVGVATFATIFLAAFVASRRKKLFFDVLGELDVSASPKRKGMPRIKKRTAVGAYAEADWRSNKPFRMLFLIEIQNAVGSLFGTLVGGVDLTKERIVKEVSFSFGKSAHVVEAEIVAQSPPDIGAEVRITGSESNGVTLEPVLLNQGDWVRIKVIVENPEVDVHKLPFGGLSQITAAGRIIGIKRIQRRRSIQTLTLYGLGVAVMSGSLSDIVALASYLIGHPEFVYTRGSTIVVGVQTALLLLAASLIVTVLRKVKRTLPPEGYGSKD